MRRLARMDPAEGAARRETRAQLLASGIPAAHVDQVVDVGFHAAQRALDSLHDVVFSAGDTRVIITALGVALGLAKARFEDQEKVMVEVGTKVGLRSKSLVVGGNHG
jgi:hypothetical protein